jgi:hypothetical protein
MARLERPEQIELRKRDAGGGERVRRDPRVLVGLLVGAAGGSAAKRRVSVA